MVSCPSLSCRVSRAHVLLRGLLYSASKCYYTYTAIPDWYSGKSMFQLKTSVPFTLQVKNTCRKHIFHNSYVIIRECYELGFRPAYVYEPRYLQSFLMCVSQSSKLLRHRWTGRYEAHLWDKSTWNTNQNKKGKQVYLGAYDEEEAAARAYDLAALKYWGPGTLINFPVSDYSRDLEEMQNTSREDYLASLRRKSSGSSRGGIAKYRGLSRASQNNRWETSFSQIGMPEYLSTIRYGTTEGTSTESEYPGGFCIERKIDLTGYFKWWGTNKTRRAEKSFEETKFGGPQDIGSELKALEWGVQPTEPYKMPSLGLPHGGKKHRGSALSALSILSRSAAYQSFKEKVMNEQDENDYSNENKNSVDMNYCKSVQIPCGDDGSERLGLLGMNWLPFQRSSCPLTDFISAPMLTPYNTVDPAADPILWTSLASVPPPRLPVVTEVTKTESSSTYACYQQEER